MARKIIGGIGSLLGIKKKKAETATPAAEQKGPIVTPLTEANTPANLRRRLVTARPRTSVLGGIGKLGQ